MGDDEKKIIIDDDWKAEAQAEKERLSQETEQPQPSTGEANFVELLNLIAMQAMAGLGLLPGPGGDRIPPNLEVAKHFVDLLQVLEDKTKNNLTDDEKQMMGQVLYDLRMRYIQTVSGAPAAAHPGAAPPLPPQGA